MEINDRLEAGIIAESESVEGVDESAVLSEQQRADIEGTANDCELKQQQMKSLLQEALWSKFGGVEILAALQVAEAECENVAAVTPDSNYEVYEFMLGHLQTVVKRLKDLHKQWQRRIPLAEQNDFLQALRELDYNVTRLESKKADFIQVRQKGEGKEMISTFSSYSMPTIKLKPTALPKFTSNKRDFHRWKKDWEALQKQGEPTGSKEVKKVQVIDSLDEKLINSSSRESSWRFG